LYAEDAARGIVMATQAYSDSEPVNLGTGEEIMPVRSLNSSVMQWPDRPIVEAALRTWAANCFTPDMNNLVLGYFGSYAQLNPWRVLRYPFEEP
jgi:hypothetical protein